MLHSHRFASLASALVCSLSCCEQRSDTAQITALGVLVDGMPVEHGAERAFPGGVHLSLQRGSSLVGGRFRIERWSVDRSPESGPPDEVVTLETGGGLSAGFAFADEGVYQIVASEHAAADRRSEPVVIHAVPFNARMSLLRRPDGRVPLLGVEVCEFELRALDGTLIENLEYRGSGTGVTMRSSLIGTFFAPSIAGASYELRAASRRYFVPPMAAITYSREMRAFGVPNFAFVPRTVWALDPAMPRYELVVGVNVFDIVMPATAQLVTGGIEVRYGDGRIDSFRLDAAGESVSVQVPALARAEWVEVRGWAAFRSASGFVATDWLPALAVAE